MARRINRDLIDAQDSAEMMRVVAAARSVWNHVNAATALHQLAKRSKAERCRVRAEDVNVLTGAVDDLLLSFEPQNLANALWAWATLGHDPGAALLGRVGEAVERQLGAFKPQELANALWAWATLGHDPGAALLGRVGEAVERQLGAFKPQGLANALWAWATLGNPAGMRCFECGATWRRSRRARRRRS